MLIWMCALHCEAKPVIDYYRLKKVHNESAYDYYQHQNVICVVSGIGIINMAGATAWAAAHFEQHQNPCWINLGVAGHQSLPVGQLVLTNKVNLAGQTHAIYPVPVVKHSLLTKSVITHSHEQSDYSEKALFDMEAYAFFQTASHFSPLELCQSIKVISDNAETAADRNKARLSQMIENHIQDIVNYATLLEKIAKPHAQQFLDKSSLLRFLALAHFTQSQQIQLKKLLLGLKGFDHQLEQSFQSIQGLDSSKKILHQLQQRLNQLCEQL